MRIELDKAQEMRSRFLLNPITISIFVTIVLLYGWLDVGNVVPTATDGEWAVVTLIGGVFYFASFYVLLPYLFSSNLTGHLPFFWQILVLASCLLAIEITLVFIFVSKESNLSSVANYFVVSLFTLTLGVLTFCTIFRANLERVFGEDPIRSILPSFLRKEINPLQALLPEKIRGEIYQLEAQSPYLLVTTAKGSALVRMSIKNAMEHLDENSGWLVHRSRWVHKSRIVGLKRRGRNRFFVDPEGNELPISREMEEPLKAYLEFPT